MTAAVDDFLLDGGFLGERGLEGGRESGRGGGLDVGGGGCSGGGLGTSGDEDCS